ncbi:glucose-6-phosphate isomerase [Planomonospora sp. ID91781]|uniref:Glucose-6-phosphate isomerase n=3 Tax=Planomonospora TaxID=1998 RepID=A0A171DHQ7_9ACTN|nr:MULTISPECIES: glucose-6-phosphate isomerase [Planomonospora]MBG0823884.1 glucose-6-phosphate isomerase [Planomonospora sp. ID91781]GAT68549.1 glucose-6-phosphate isomerase [Planomonospora sphaerica]GGK66038.1 glucose-6-phosphate isomerase [Planomonospora parontospora]GII08435.1 glucose-6-phosphate isomerase [Planomonospora parontospora subsp. parontospora]
MAVSVTFNEDRLAEQAAETVRALVADGVHERLAAGDAALWGEEARAEAAVRLGWLTLPLTSRELLPEIGILVERARAQGLDHVVLAGMGGSSLAPEVICTTADVPLTVLDTTDPAQVRRALADRLERTIVVVASKSGGTVETDSHRRIYEQAFRDAGIDPAERIVVVTDPGSPLEQAAIEAGYPVILADPNVGGRYSALSAFGLVPSALAGADVLKLLDDAAAVQPLLAQAEGNPGLELGAALGAAALAGRDKLVLEDSMSEINGLPDWIEQLVAESTGKSGKGILPVVGADPNDSDDELVAGIDSDGSVTVAGPLGAQFLVWEYATAVAGRVLGIDPFNQPNVTESKENTNRLLAAGELPVGAPALVDGPVEVYGEGLEDAKDLSEVFTRLLQDIPDDDGYLAVMAYLDREAAFDVPVAEDASFEAMTDAWSAADPATLRGLLAVRTDRPVTFGWGPRFLHSTGQYHKGGPQNGVFLQITGAVEADLEVPGKPYTLGRLQMAQALGDQGALTGRARPTVRLHLTDRAAGVARLLAAAREV